MLEADNSLSSKRSTKNYARKINKSSKFLASKKIPPNGTTVGVGKPIMVDVATASPPSKFFHGGRSAIKVVANYRSEQNQKYVVEPLVYKQPPYNPSYNPSYQQNHVCGTKGKNTNKQPTISKSHSEKDGISTKGCYYSSVEESCDDSVQKTITSFIAAKEPNLTKHTQPRKNFQKIDVENHQENTECGKVSQYYSNELRGSASYSDFQCNVFPKSETLSEIEGISQSSSKSPSLSPITGCERLL